jgi:hypothetical protein
MRNLAILMTAAATLAACGGGGDAQSASGAVAGGGGASTGASSGSTATTNTDVFAQFVTPTLARTYSGVGTSQVYQYSTDNRTPTNGTTGLTGARGQQQQVYAGNASTVRDSKISITYDPRDAIFTLKVTDPRSGAAAETRFQDPASRTNFGGALEPQWGVTNFATMPGVAQNTNIRYLQAGDGNPLSPFRQSGNGAVWPGTNQTPPDGDPGSAYQSTTFFYEVPGATTNFVSLAGYARNAINWVDVNGIAQTQWKLERGVFAYGIQSDNGTVPTTGSGTYTGNLIANVIFNPTLDSAATNYPTFFQWMSGTSTTTVNFATGAVGLSLSGVVGAPIFDRYTTPHRTALAAGATFTAAGIATIDLVRTGGFVGQFQSAAFSATTDGSSPVVNIAGSSIDGAFFGPAANEVGGGFRIVGGTPDQRIDIGGAFKGKRP